ncbi:hypothetical protein Tco_1545862 [Tanacetum coccineum]
MEKRNIQDRNVLSTDHHRAFRKIINDLESFKEPDVDKVLGEFILIEGENSQRLKRLSSFTDENESKVPNTG